MSVSPGLRLSDYSTTPLYNIKAVVQATDLTPSTLRAWERRYNMCEPQRSESGYRLYSERDVAVIRWLKSQVDAGMSISQAVSWLENLSKESDGRANAILPMSDGSVSIAEAPAPRPPQQNYVRSFAAFRDELTHALLEHDETSADELFSEAFAMHSIEDICEFIITPVQIAIGEKWHNGEISVTDEHFATNYLRFRLSTLFRAVTRAADGPLIWVGCAPGELHELAALMISVFLLRYGYRVHYFGQNIPAEELANEISKHQPAMLLFSATTDHAARELIQLSKTLSRRELSGTPPLIGYGGQIFTAQPDLRSNMEGVYLGDTAKDSIAFVNKLLMEKVHNSRNGR